MLSRLVEDEKVPDEEFLSAMNDGGWEPGRPNDYVRDIVLVRLERAAREAVTKLPELREKSKQQRAAIREKGESLGLPGPYIVGDVCGNVNCRYPQLKTLVAEFAATLKTIKTMELDERVWKQDGPELAARRAGRAA